MTQPVPLSVAIPTFGRDEVLLDSLRALLDLSPPAAEILVLDQTPRHSTSTDARLGAWNDTGRIRWVRLAEPSIPRAMNRALQLATQPFVLFLDDDIIPDAGLLQAHLDAQTRLAGVIVAGRVIQPWEEGRAFDESAPFRFAGLRSAWIREFMGGNFSVPRALALELGGFDENFVRVAYRFEAEFAHRYLATGLRIWFEPSACIHHLKANSGGTRTYGEHLTTSRPDHAVGDYYYSLRSGKLGTFLVRPVKSIITRYHLRRPWQIPATLWAEFRGMAWALSLYRRGPRHVAAQTGGSNP